MVTHLCFILMVSYVQMISCCSESGTTLKVEIYVCDHIVSVYFAKVCFSASTWFEQEIGAYCTGFTLFLDDFP